MALMAVNKQVRLHRGSGTDVARARRVSGQLADAGEAASGGQT